MRTKVSGPESLELALVMKKKERKNDNWLFFYTAGSGILDHFHGCMGA